MTFHRHAASFPRLSADDMAMWRTIPSTIASDAMRRSNAMHASIKPLHPTMRVCGQARTVLAMPGDNSVVHIACSLAGRGEVVVVDGAGMLAVAMAGGMVSLAGTLRGIEGLVVDGVVRDGADSISLAFPVFSRGLVARGPHKEFGGEIDGSISAGGVVVKPGDIIIGDIDGVIVIPLDRAAEIRDACHALLATEEAWRKRLHDGELLVDIFKIEMPEIAE